jgi:putative ABC transport system substrate-binding protein
MRRRTFIAALGGAVAWPMVALGQQQAMPVIGYLSGWSLGDAVEYLDYFRQGLSEAGYTETRNVRIEYRFAEGHFDRLAALVDDLVRRHVNVIAVPNTTAAAIAAKAATKDIPIAFSLGSNPVEVGLVASLNHPGGNLTGLTALQTAVMGKRLELLHELMPAATAIALLVNPANRALAEADTREAQATANALGVNLLILKASSPSEIDEAFATVFREKAGALLTNSESYFMIQGRAARSAGGASFCARFVCIPREHGCGRPYELWSKLSYPHARARPLRRPHSQGRKAIRSPSATIYKSRTRS